MKLRYAPSKFSSLASARSFAARCVKAQMVILGDDGKFWVVCMADAEKLIKAGYEVA